MNLVHLKSWRFSLRELFAFSTLACVLIAIAQLGEGITMLCCLILLPIGFGFASLLIMKPQGWWLAGGAFLGLFLAGTFEGILAVCFRVPDLASVPLASDQWHHAFDLRQVIKVHSVALGSLAGMAISYVYQRNKLASSKQDVEASRDPTQSQAAPQADSPL